MQSLYAHSIGYMTGGASLSHRLGGLDCLYCLYENQPFKPPFKIYLSLGKMIKLTELVADAKEYCITVVFAVVKRMLEKKTFLFGCVEIDEGFVIDTVNQLLELQNAYIQVAYNNRLEQFLHMDSSSAHLLSLTKCAMADQFWACEEDCAEVAVPELQACVPAPNQGASTSKSVEIRRERELLFSKAFLLVLFCAVLLSNLVGAQKI